jgi:hypothetical protein
MNTKIVLDNIVLQYKIFKGNNLKTEEFINNIDNILNPYIVFKENNEKLYSVGVFGEEKYNKLTVKGIINKVINNKEVKYAICDCECGNKNVEKIYTEIKRGKIKSCGCLQKEHRKKISDSLYSTKHNMTNSRIYNIHKDMKQRCYNKNAMEYENYGGRGIAICEEWLNKKSGFMNFYNWIINNGYQDDLTIDRIDVNGNYEPSNCRWITIEEQQNNKQNTIYVFYNNTNIALPVLLKELKREKDYGEILYRLKHKNMTIDDALNDKVIKGKKIEVLINGLIDEFNNKELGYKMSREIFYNKYNLNREYFNKYIKNQKVKDAIEKIKIKFNKKYIEKY